MMSKKSFHSENGASNGTTSTKLSSPASEQKTVKKLKLSKALALPEYTSVYDACRRMAARRVDAVLLKDANENLSGIMTDKDIVTKVIAEGLRLENTTVSKIMTRNPIFVNGDSLAMEALQTMIEKKFRHLPVVENGEVTALLDITKCLYSAITKVEKIAAAVEGLEILRERMFKPPALSLFLVGENNITNSAPVIVSPSESVYAASKRMQEFRVNSVIIIEMGSSSKVVIKGMLTSKDILMRVVAQGLSPQLTPVTKVMTPNPQCATLETTIIDALHTMHEGKLSHLPVLDGEGNIAACVDILQITQAAISVFETNSSAGPNVMLQEYLDSASSSAPFTSDQQSIDADTTDARSEMYSSLGLENSFAFKFEDRTGRVHRMNWDTEMSLNLDELVYAVMQRTGDHNAAAAAKILYDDEEGDRVVIASDDDLASAVGHVRAAGQKVLRLHLDGGRKKGWSYSHTGIWAGTCALTGIGFMAYLRRTTM